MFKLIGFLLPVFVYGLIFIGLIIMFKWARLMKWVDLVKSIPSVSEFEDHYVSLVGGVL